MKRSSKVKVRSDNHAEPSARIQCYICVSRTSDYRLTLYRGKAHYLCVACADSVQK